MKCPKASQRDAESIHQMYAASCGNCHLTVPEDSPRQGQDSRPVPHNP